MKKPLMFIILCLIGPLLFGKAAFAVMPGDVIYEDHRSVTTFTDELGGMYLEDFGSFYVPMDGLYNVSLMDASMGHPDYTPFSYLEFDVDGYAFLETGTDVGKTMATDSVFIPEGWHDLSLYGDIYDETPLSLITVGYGASISLVPELETWIMMFFGVAGILFVVRRRQDQETAPLSMSFA